MLARRPRPSPGIVAFQAARARGVPALEASAIALAVEAAHAPHARLKSAARDALALGLTSRGCRARYGVWFDAVRDRGMDLDGAIFAIDRAWRTDRARRDRIIAAGYPAPSRLPLMVLAELRLLLRWLRVHEPFRLPEILDPRPVVRAVEVEAAE